MQQKIKATPEKLFAEATAFMVGSGASVQSRDTNSITFAASPGAAAMAAMGSGGLSTLVALFDFGAAMSMQTASAVTAGTVQTATLVASEGEDGEASTVVTLADTQNIPNNMLRTWFIADVLRVSLGVPLMEIRASYHKVLIWNDRVEAYARVMRWKLKDTIHMDDIQSVGADKRLVTVRATDGREISIKALVREDAQKAKGIVEARLAVHRTPSFAL